MAKPLILAKLANFFGLDGSGNILPNPASSKIFTVGASVASNALTVTLAPCTIDFRSATLTSGAVNTRMVATTLSLVVPSTATLGTINAIQNRLVVLALDNAGTVELAITNISGGTNLDETGVISTTILNASSTSATVVYSTTARTSVPYRVVGYVESTQATAGTWVTAPSTIQGQGGQALAAMTSLGYGQTWQNVTGSRAGSTTYYNTTGKPICVRISLNSLGAGSTQTSPTVNGVALGFSVTNAPSAGIYGWDTFIVPAGASYSVAFSNSSPNIWNELR